MTTTPSLVVSDAACSTTFRATSGSEQASRPIPKLLLMSRLTLQAMAVAVAAVAVAVAVAVVAAVAVAVLVVVVVVAVVVVIEAVLRIFYSRWLTLRVPSRLPRSL